MKKATVQDLRTNFHRLSKWLAAGETIEILRHGKAVADLVPKAGGKPGTLLGATPGPYPLPADIDDPVFAHATPGEPARVPMAYIEHSQILVRNDASAPKARHKKAQGNALGKSARNRKP